MEPLSGRVAIYSWPHMYTHHRTASIINTNKIECYVIRNMATKYPLPYLPKKNNVITLILIESQYFLFRKIFPSMFIR